MTTADYLALITNAHQGKPCFAQTVTASVAPLAKVQSALDGLIQDFDLDTAIGVQLDIIGQWVGRSRRIQTPLTGVYFTWGGAADVGWGSGIWQGPYDPDSGLVDLPDDAYRTLLRAKIAANRWDGSIPQAYVVWAAAFPGSIILAIQDHQDMSMTINAAGTPLSVVEKALLINGYIPLKPEGVRIAAYYVVPAAGPIFAWGIPANPAFAGWGTGQWATALTPA